MGCHCWESESRVLRIAFLVHWYLRIIRTFPPPFALLGCSEGVLHNMLERLETDLAGEGQEAAAEPAAAEEAAMGAPAVDEDQVRLKEGTLNHGAATQGARIASLTTCRPLSLEGWSI